MCRCVCVLSTTVVDSIVLSPNRPKSPSVEWVMDSLITTAIGAILLRRSWVGIGLYRFLAVGTTLLVCHRHAAYQVTDVKIASRWITLIQNN